MVFKAKDEFLFSQTEPGTYETTEYDAVRDFSTSFQVSWTLGGFTNVVITPMVSLDGENYTELTDKAQTETTDSSGVFISNNTAVIYYKFKYVITGTGTFDLKLVSSRMYS